MTGSVSSPITLREGIGEMDFDRIHQWLTTSYWAAGISRVLVKQAAANSTLVLGAFTADGAQVGYLRVVSDTVRFAYIMDVFVDAGHRRQGIAGLLVGGATGHPRLALVRKWTLATRDAHPV